MLKRKVAFVFAILMLTCFGCSFGACKNNDESEKPGAEISTEGEVDSGDEKESEEDSDDEEQIQYFNSLSLKQYASTISNYLDKAFGTGFLFTTEDGKQIIITNNHVINGTSFATIKFENQDGTYLEYKDLKIIYKNYLYYKQQKRCDL